MSKNRIAVSYLLQSLHIISYSSYATSLSKIFSNFFSSIGLIR